MSLNKTSWTEREARMKATAQRLQDVAEELARTARELQRSAAEFSAAASQLQSRTYESGGLNIEIGMRKDASMWISIEDDGHGKHFQCHYHGNYERGPVYRHDFASSPPEWVEARLGLK